MELLVVVLLVVVCGGQAFLLYKQSIKTQEMLKSIIEKNDGKTVVSLPFEQVTDGMPKDPERVPLDEVDDETFVRAVKKSLNPLQEPDYEAEKAKEDLLS